MDKPKVSLIAAIGKNRELGKNNKLLWHIPEDMQWFRQHTQNHVVIMGRKTYDSIGKALPQRTNIVITRDPLFQRSDCIVVHSFEDAITTAKKSEQSEIFVIGGGQIYAQAIHSADKLYLTIVKKTYDADTFFPDYSAFKKVLFRKESRHGNLRYIFLTLVKS